MRPKSWLINLIYLSIILKIQYLILSYKIFKKYDKYFLEFHNTKDIVWCLFLLFHNVLYNFGFNHSCYCFRIKLIYNLTPDKNFVYNSHERGNYICAWFKIYFCKRDTVIMFKRFMFWKFWVCNAFIHDSGIAFLFLLFNIYKALLCD